MNSFQIISATLDFITIFSSSAGGFSLSRNTQKLDFASCDRKKCESIEL